MVGAQKVSSCGIPAIFILWQYEQMMNGGFLALGYEADVLSAAFLLVLFLAG